MPGLKEKEVKIKIHFFIGKKKISQDRQQQNQQNNQAALKKPHMVLLPKGIEKSLLLSLYYFQLLKIHKLIKVRHAEGTLAGLSFVCCPNLLDALSGCRVEMKQQLLWHSPHRPRQMNTQKAQEGKLPLNGVNQINNYFP